MGRCRRHCSGHVGGEIIHVVGWSWEWALEVGGEGRLGVGLGSGNIWGQMSMGFQTEQLGKIATLALLGKIRNSIRKT